MMRVTILRPDGTKIEADGTAEEIAKLVGSEPCMRLHWQPCTLPRYPDRWPNWLYGGGITYTSGLGQTNAGNGLLGQRGNGAYSAALTAAILG